MPLPLITVVGNFARSLTSGGATTPEPLAIPAPVITDPVFISPNGNTGGGLSVPAIAGGAALVGFAAAVIINRRR